MHWVSTSSVTGIPRQTSCRKWSLVNEHAGILKQQQQRVEITGVEFHRNLPGEQPAFGGIEGKAREVVAAGGHFRNSS
jgi:hypothetical protein